MLMDTHPSQRHAGLEYAAVFLLKPEVTMPKTSFKPTLPEKSEVDGEQSGANISRIKVFEMNLVSLILHLLVQVPDLTFLFLLYLDLELLHPLPVGNLHVLQLLLGSFQVGLRSFQIEACFQRHQFKKPGALLLA